jgi:uncharacterized protein YegP (UPF0339 family)
MQGILLPVRERHEQINKHGYDLVRDRKFYQNGELVDAAMFFLTGDPKLYPPKWDQKYKVSVLSRKTILQRIVIATALLMAEVDRRTKSKIALPDLELRRAHTEKGDQFYFVVRAKNGQVLSTSETYTRRASARRACNRLNESIGSYLLILDATDNVHPLKGKK